MPVPAAGHERRRPPALRRWWVVAATVALAAALGAGGGATGSATAAGSAGTELAASGAGSVPATPLLSVRRAPGWLAATLAGQRVAAAVAAVLTPAALGAAAGHSCLVVEQGSRLLAAIAPDQPVTPASNMKLLTAFAALDQLGPGYRYTTAVTASTAPVGGVVAGDLYLIGGGDPLLRTARYQATIRHALPTYTSLAALAAQVRAAGITEVTGPVVGDESRYDTVRAVPTWKPVYTEEGDAGPLSALGVDNGFVATPAGFARAPQPAVAAAQTFTALLRADGTAVGGPPTSGVAPPPSVPVTSIRSAPLSEILGAILVPSDDTAAELVTKELGRAAGGGGSTAAGTAAIRSDLQAAGLPVAGLEAVDGSGLDRGDRVTCRLVASLLQRAGANSPLASALPVAGRSGTLTTRLGAPLTVGRIVAKTGTLDDVSALSGFVLPSTSAPAPTVQLQAPVVFSLVMDGVPMATGVALGNSLATALAGYPVVPAVSALGPQP